MREDLALVYFITALRDPEIQHALRLTDVKDVDFSLACSLKCWATQHISRLVTKAMEQPLYKVRVSNLKNWRKQCQIS